MATGKRNACQVNIDNVNIDLTGVVFASSRIFTLSILGSAIQARGHLGQYRASNIAIASRSPPPSPPTGFARGRFFTSKDRPHCHRLAIARTDQPRHVERTHLSSRLVSPTERPSSSFQSDVLTTMVSPSKSRPPRSHRKLIWESRAAQNLPK